MKYALIGCGRIATNHMKAAINNKLEIVAVCDVFSEKMEALLAKHDLQTDTSIKRYEDYKQMVAEEKPDLVSIATESGIHAEIALYCIEQGVNLIIEKLAEILHIHTAFVHIHNSNRTVQHDFDLGSHISHRFHDI